MRQLFSRLLPVLILALFCLHFHPVLAQNIYYNAGGAQYISLAGDTFVTDLFYTPSATSTYTNPTAGLEIDSTLDDVLYRTERSANVNGGSFGYNIPVPNGTYKVQLHFAEIYFGATGGNNSNPPHTGKRVFDVSVEGNLVLDNYDIFAEVGAMRAVVKEYDSVAVSDANLDIDFASVTNKAKISAISIIQLSVAPPDSNNTAPTFTISGDVTVNEDFAGTQTVTVTPDPVPPADSAQTVTYSLTPPSVGFANVSINSSTGLVSITKVTNGNGAQLFTITANDGQGLNNTATQTFTLTVNAVNDAPSFVTSGNVTVNENFAGTQTVTVTPAAVPADETGQTVTYSLNPSSVAFANVSINTSTGQVSITSVPDAFGSQLFTITADDGQSLNNTATQSFTLTVNDTTSTPVEQDAIFFNCGGPQYVSLAGDTFVPDLFYSSGTTTSSNNIVPDIAGTDDDVLYRTERFKNDFTYNIPVQNGAYTVKLHFAEIFFGVAGGNLTPPFTGKRIFHVVLEGDSVLKNYDINADVGPDTAVIKQFNTQINDGAVTIHLKGVVNNAKISAISIEPANQTPNTPPTVSITSPADGASFMEGNGIQIDADADDTDGNISKVEFYENGNLLHTDFDFPYSFTWNNATPGSKALTAKAYDNDNAFAVSDTVNITVTEDLPPNVSIISPADGENFSEGANILIEADANDDVAVTLVEFYEGANLLGADSSSPFEFTWNTVPAGNYSLTAKAHDSIGNETTSGVIIIHVAGDVPPTVSITSPADGATFIEGTSTLIEADANDDVAVTRVEFYEGLNLLGADSTFPYSFLWNNIPAGVYSLTAKAFDTSLNETTSTAITVTYETDSPPSITFTNPTDGATFIEGASILIEANASDDVAVTHVEFYEGVNLLGSDSTSPYSFNWITPAIGNYSLTAKAFDNNTQSTTSAPVSVEVVADAPPAVSITSPVDGASFTEGQTVVINATATDDVGIAQVDFYAGATFLGSDNTFPYTFSWTNVPHGNYSLTATAFDTQFQATISDAVNITVDTIPAGNMEALLVVGNLLLNNGDQALKTRMETLGFNVTVVSASASSSADANGKNLVFLSSTVTAAAVGTKFTHASAPVINCEQALHDDLGMTSGVSGNSGSTANQTQINIIGAGHPLAAGLPNTPVTVYTSAQTVTWGKPSNNAVKIATTMSSSSQIAIFGYESGAAMVLGNAPARRVGFFLQDAGAAFLTASGTALLDAAITWAANSTPPPPNNPPSVSITNPLDGAVFVAPANITIDATASDPDLGGSISLVEFYEGANLLGSDNSFPYSFNWNGVAQGNYQLTAKAFDNLNASTTSAIINISVNVPANNAPSVSITNPLDGAVFVAPANITIDATASDPDLGGSISLVEFYEGANLLGSDNSFPYSFNWTNVPQGNYQLTAKAFDNLNVSATSTVVNIVVNAPANNPPLVNITNPLDGAVFVAPANITIDATASDPDLGGSISLVEFYEGANLLGSDNSFPYSFNWTNVPQGNYQLTAKAFDNFLASSTSSIVNVTVNAAPTLGDMLFVVGNLTLNSGDNAVKARLETLGYSVTLKHAPASTASDATGKTAVIISSTVNSVDVGNKFANSPVPLMNYEQALHDDLKMTSSGNGGTTANQTLLNIIGAGHPLAAGLSNGLTAVYASGQTISWGKPGVNALKIATQSGNANNIAIFGYESNSPMVGLNAPARRLGFFLQDVGAAFLTANGTALFDAAINWLVSTPTPNNPPSVNITNPLDGAVFIAPASITIDATASDPDFGGSISLVEFYNGATLLGSDNSAPYSFNWTNVPQGNYQLTAKAFDNLNVSATSTVVNIVVNAPANNPPLVNITNPLDGAVFVAPANITIDATASDPDLGGSISLVEFYEGANLLGSDNSAPYSFNWTNVPQGNYQLTAKAFDNLNMSATSAIINITVNQLPTVTITSPANGAIFNEPANVTINATAGDIGGSISLVEFYNGATLLGSDNSAPYSFNWNNVSAGNYQLTAKAFDNLNASATSAIVNITVNAVNQPPVVNITNPLNGASFTAPANVAIAATATDPDAGNTIAKVEFYVGNTLLGTDYTSPYSLNWNGVGNGTYQLKAKAFDNLNASAFSSIVTITVGAVVNQPPVVSITNPLNGAVFVAPANITIDATASDPTVGGSILKVEFYEGANLLGTDFSAPYQFAWNGVTAGSYQLTAKAFDNLNATTTSSIITITVMNPAALTALYVVGNTTLNTGDAAVKAKLESMGYTVTVVGDAASTTADATGKTIVLISATVASGNVNTKFTNVVTPVINSEPGLMDDLKLTGTATTEYGSAFNQTQINIIGAGHPLAAGLPNGLTTVFNSVQTTIWGKPNGNAVSIATIAANATQVCIFGYPAGASMFGINAPARRVGFMIADATPASLNTAGMQLLEAAILWAAGTTKNDEFETMSKQTPSDFDVNIYPNPSSGLVNLELHNALEGKLSVGVYNQFGHEARFAEQTIDNAFHREQFDLSALPAGLYFVRVTNGETQLTRRLLIVK